MKIIVTAGGTGGHIYPALALIKSLKKDEVYFVGTSKGMEKDIIASLSIPYLSLDMKGFDRRKLYKNYNLLFKYLKAKRKVKKLIKDFKPDCVIGFGGYVSLPVLRCAQEMNIKTFIHEQNSLPGLANKLAGKRATKIFVSFPSSLSYFSKNKAVITGNPRGDLALNVTPMSLKELGFKDKKPLVLIVMGSLGSLIISQKLVDMLPLFKGKPYNVLIISGKNYYSLYQDYPQNVKVISYSEELLNIMALSHLVVSRSGATIISEIISLKKPSLFIPSPHVTSNHQMKNALVLKENKAALIIEEKNFKEQLIPTIDKIMKNKVLQKEMADNATKLGINNSCYKIIKNIKEELSK